MHPCPFCACHVRTADVTCPHCGTRISSGAPSLSAVILSLAIAGCTGGAGTKSTAETGTNSTVEPAYGISSSQVDYGTSYTDSDTDADSDTDTDTDTDTDSDTDSGTTGDTGGSSGGDTAAR